MAQILIVDDDRVMLKYLSDALKKAGHEIQTAENGLDALEHVKAYNVDLLLTDIVMPGMDGIALSKKASVISPDLKILGLYSQTFSSILKLKAKEILGSSDSLGKTPCCNQAGNNTTLPSFGGYLAVTPLSAVYLSY